MAVGLATQLACTAELGTNSGGGEGTPPGSGVGASLVGSGDGDGDQGPSVGRPFAANPNGLPDQPSPGYVRRLTHVEYDNTIADLLGDTSEPSTGFESDLAQDGFTNNAAGQNVSPTLAEQYMVAAETISENATGDLNALLGCDPLLVGEQVCAQQFIATFGRRAFRRPLSAEEGARMNQLFQTAREDFDFEVSVQLVLQAFLQSPQFLYLLEPSDFAVEAGTIEPLDPWQLASRLSYFIIGSMPDELLMAAAESGEFSTPEAVGIQARRLLELPRARERIALFFTEWLRLRSIDRMEKDGAMFPDYNLNLAQQMRQQVELFATDVILDQNGTSTDLLTATHTFMTPELAPLYDVPSPNVASNQFERVELDPTRRAGLLTHVAMMANLAHTNQTDPVHRGKFVRGSLLCEAVPAPPVDAAIVPPVVSPDATTR